MVLSTLVTSDRLPGGFIFVVIFPPPHFKKVDCDVNVSSFYKVPLFFIYKY